MKKRKPGRPKGTTKLPTEYVFDLVTLPDALRPARKLSLVAMCRLIIAQAGPQGVKWVDRQGKSVARIKNAATLRTRIESARRLLRNVKVVVSTTRRIADVKAPMILVESIRINVTSTRSARQTALWVGEKKLHN